MDNIEMCTVCRGGGQVWVDQAHTRPGDPLKVCPACGGAGKVLKRSDTVRCAVCGGGGKKWANKQARRYKDRSQLLPCEACDGLGRLKLRRV